ncbi:MAG TPA: hypothetical protein VGH20_17030 [Myxococcales bacterium]|jgi:hypothetical protein
MRSLAVAIALGTLAGCRSHPPHLHSDPQALGYRSRSKVTDAMAVRIAAEAVGDARRRPAWSEPNHVHATDGPFGNGRDKYLYGEARLYLVEYETDPGKFREVDPHDDAVMAYADALFTVRQLQEWAREASVDWDVKVAKSKGIVTADGPDEKAKAVLEQLAKKAGSPKDPEALRAELDAKYRDRR